VARKLLPNSDLWGGAWGAVSAWGGTWGWSFGPLHEVEDKIKWDDVGGGPERHELKSELDDWDWIPQRQKVSRDDKDLVEMLHMITVSGILSNPCLRTRF